MQGETVQEFSSAAIDGHLKRILATWHEQGTDELPVPIASWMERAGWWIEVRPMESPAVDAFALIYPLAGLRVAFLDAELSDWRQRFALAWIYVHELAGESGVVTLHRDQPGFARAYADQVRLKAACRLLIPDTVFAECRNFAQLAARCAVPAELAAWRVRWAPPSERIYYLRDDLSWRVQHFSKHDLLVALVGHIFVGLALWRLGFSVMA